MQVVKEKIFFSICIQIFIDVPLKIQLMVS